MRDPTGVEHQWAVCLESPLEEELVPGSHISIPSRTGLDLDLEGSMVLDRQTSSESIWAKRILSVGNGGWGRGAQDVGANRGVEGSGKDEYQAPDMSC